MAMKPCRECGTEVSTSAKVCPHCGKKSPADRLNLPAKLFVGFIAILAIWQVVSQSSGQSPTADIATAAVVPTPPVDTTLSFADIRRQMRSDLTEAQFNALARSLEGRRVRWRGWVEDVNEKALGGYELWIDMDRPSDAMSVQDVTFDVPADLALSYRKDSRVSFEGTIDEVMNVLGSLQVELKDARVLP